MLDYSSVTHDGISARAMMDVFIYLLIWIVRGSRVSFAGKAYLTVASHLTYLIKAEEFKVLCQTISSSCHPDIHPQINLLRGALNQLNLRCMHVCIMSDSSSALPFSPMQPNPSSLHRYYNVVSWELISAPSLRLGWIPKLNDYSLSGLLRLHSN